MHRKTVFLSRPLTELIFAVLMGIVLATGGLIGYTTATEEIKRQRTVTQIHLITGRLRLWFSEHPITALSNDELAAINVLTDADYDGGKTFHPFSKDDDPSGIVFSFIPRTFFSVTWRDLPRKACLYIAPYNFGHATSFGLVSMTLATDKKSKTFFFPPKKGKSPDEFLPLSPETAQKYCTHNTDITWTYR